MALLGIDEPAAGAVSLLHTRDLIRRRTRVWRCRDRWSCAEAKDAMPSPFPGMDPYLEEPSGWPGVHHRLITIMSDLLTEQLAPHFYVSIEERVYISDLEEPGERRQIAPDIYLVERPGTGSPLQPGATVVTPPTLIEPLYELEVRDRYLEIHDRRTREVVTIVELLSPRNKAAGSEGRRQFITKRDTIFSTQTHWVEIDLLRAGERPDEVAGKSDYYALLHRSDSGGRLAVWFVDLRDRLPRITIPLRQPHDDAVLDLHAALDTVYTRARYAAEIDYTQPVPPPTLRPADALWVAESVRAWLAEQATEE
jgi:hypothetical protein